MLTTQACVQRRYAILGMVALHALGVWGFAQTVSLRPVASTGPHVTAGTEIFIAPGGAFVDLEITLSNWGVWGSQLGGAQATLDASSLLGANAVPANPGVDLVPLGYALPDPDGGNRAEGLQQRIRVCSLSGRSCSDGEPGCAGNEGSCMHNPRFVFPESTQPFGFASTDSLNNYSIGAISTTFQGVEDPANLNQGYLGTLRLIVPAEAVGTYTVRLHNNENLTFMNDAGAASIYLKAMRAARIHITTALPASPALGVPKNRFLSLEPHESGEPTGFSLPLAYRVMLLSSSVAAGAEGQFGWLGTPVAHPTMGYVSRVETAPVFRQWTEGIVQVGDCEIIPGSAYAVSGTPDATNFPYSQEIITAVAPVGKEWGDVAGMFNGQQWSLPDGFANVTDILAVLSRARGDATGLEPSRANLMATASFDPCLNNLVNTADVLMIVFAVRGEPYLLVRDLTQCPACP